MAIATRNLADKDLNRFERGILKNIQKHGWHANGIPGEGSSLAWAYSVGLFAKYSQPELIIFGLEIATMHQMIARYADLLQAGKEYGDGVKITNVDDDDGYYTGIIDNEQTHATAAYGDELQFHPLHIAEIAKKRRRWPWQSK